MSRHFHVLAILFILVVALALQPGDVIARPNPVARSAPVIIDHRNTNLSQVPAVWINQAKNLLRLSYGHTSHGSQLVSGMDAIRGVNPLFNFNTNGSRAAGVLSLHDTTPGGDLGNPDLVTWAASTRTYLNGPTGTGPSRNVVMWSWCGQVSSASETDINTYLGLMNQLETDYSNVNFVYMTGHLDGQSAGNLKTRNSQIRNYAMASNKVLFDFADIESYDPAGNYYPGESDGCAWCDNWCSSHPEDCQNLPTSCAHSHPLQCKLKGEAFWWMMARLAGWPGPGSGSIPLPPVMTASDGAYLDRVQGTWTSVADATSYLVSRSESLGGPKIPANGYSTTSLGGNDLWAVPGSTYYYWVKACNASGCSDFSAAETGWRGLTPPVVTASDGSKPDKVQVTWPAVSGASSYLAYRSSSQAGEKFPANGYPITSLGGDDLWATPGVTYYYWVKACNGSNCSALSAYNTGWR